MKLFHSQVFFKSHDSHLHLTLQDTSVTYSFGMSSSILCAYYLVETKVKFLLTILRVYLKYVYVYMHPLPWEREEGRGGGREGSIIVVYGLGVQPGNSDFSNLSR